MGLFYSVKNPKYASTIPNEYVTFLDGKKFPSYSLKGNDILYPIIDDEKKKEFFKNEFQRFRDVGYNLEPGIIDNENLMYFLCNYYKSKHPFHIGNKLALLAFRILWVKGINAIYEEQGVNIAFKHFELIICQMTKKAVLLSLPFLKKNKPTKSFPFSVGEKVSFSYLLEMAEAIQKTKDTLKEKEEKLKIEGDIIELEKLQKKMEFLELDIPQFIPIVMSSSKSALEKSGFFSSAGFQQTKNVLLKAAVEGRKDWFRGLKESISIGKLIPAGTSYLNKKYSLDAVYYYQKKKVQTKD